MPHWKKWTCAVIAAVTACLPAHAWGPKADIAVVIGASNQLLKSINVPLRAFSTELQQGASLPRQSLLNLYPALELDPIGAIETEMSLLQGVRAQEMDPYFAYRLGALGKLVATATSPMQEANATYRDLYYADIEQHIEGVSLSATERRLVSPRDYFRDAIYAANQNNDLIERAYQTGSGFTGVASTSLQTHASRSINAITDVWHTILSGAAISARVSTDQRESYTLDAFRFYIERGKNAEIQDAAQRLERITPLTTPMRAKIANYYYEAEMFDRAIQEYETVLTQDPTNKNAQDRIAEYYVMKGEQALESQKYEDAVKAFRQAANASPLGSRGEEMRLHAEQLIEMRNANYDTLHELLLMANQKVEMAEAEAQNRHYAEAIALMREAIDSYESIGDQFPDLAQERITRTRRATLRMDELRQGMMQNVRNFSGMGYAVDAGAMARQLTVNLERDTLQRMVQTEFEKELNALEQKLAPSFAID